MTQSEDPYSLDLSGISLDGGRLAIHERLDQGGMGTVYTATQTSLGRKVIVKVPHVRFLGEPGFRERFAREIKRLIGLEHPQIVSIITQGEHDHVPYFVLQYLAGGSLVDRLKAAPGRRMSLEEVMRWLPDVAKALDFVHRRDVVHRDVKPANILFDEDDNVFLSDFGIAKAIGDGSADATSLTGTGTGIGSPPYMSPEQGLGREIDATADQYALAATVYEALGGRPPFEGGTPMEVLLRKAQHPPPDLAPALTAQSAGVAAAVMQALEREPQDRHAGCLAFVEAIRMAVYAQGGREAPTAGMEGAGATGVVPKGKAPKFPAAKKQPKRPTKKRQGSRAKPANAPPRAPAPRGPGLPRKPVAGGPAKAAAQGARVRSGGLPRKSTKPEARQPPTPAAKTPARGTAPTPAKTDTGRGNETGGKAWSGRPKSEAGRRRKRRLAMQRGAGGSRFSLILGLIVALGLIAVALKFFDVF